MAVVLPAPTVRRHKITPRLADAWAQCPLRAMTPSDSSGSQVLAWGSAIHTLLKLDGRRQLGGHCLLEPEELVLRGTPNTSWRQDEAFMSLATSCIAGMRTFLAEQDLKLLRVEEFVRSGDIPITGVPGVAVVLSGRIDAVCRGPGGRLVILDAKTGSRLPTQLELSELPSTWIYTYLGSRLRSQQPAIAELCMRDIEVLQVLPHRGEWVAEQLTPKAIAAGRMFMRQMVLDLDQQAYAATPGEHCAYCPIGLAGECPAMPQGQTDEDETL